MAILFKNNAASTLTYKMTDAQEVMYVADASVFPVIADGSGDVFKLTLVGEDTLEIVEAFAAYNPEGRQGFKIRRAQEDTTAQAWPVGTRVEMRITAEALNSFVPTAVQIAQDNLDAVGVASTTNVGFAGVDGKTTQADTEGVITAKDVAIGGNLEDLASARGIFNTLTKGSVDCNTLTKQGVYAISLAGTVNGPGFSAKLVVFNGKGSVFTNQMAIAAGAGTSGAIRVAYRSKNNENVWSPWSEGILSGRVGDGITVNNGIISVPEYEGATASAAGTAGLVPPAAAGEQESFLTGGGEYKPALSTKGGLLTGSVQINDTANVIGTAPAENAERGVFVADKNGAIMGGFDNIQRASDNVKLTQMFAKSSGGNITTLAAVAHEDGTGEVVTYHPIQISGVQLNQTIDSGNRVFVLSGDRTNEGYTFRFSPDTGEAYMDGRAIHAKADSAVYADTAGSAPANGGTAWQTTIVPNVTYVGRGGSMPAGGSWLYIYMPYDTHYLRSAILAGGAGAPDNDGGIAIKIG